MNFVVHGTQLCIDLHKVIKVLSLMAVQAVPRAPNYLQGLMNLHGESVPLIDLGERLGLANAIPYTLDTPVVLIADGDKRAGLVVSEILDVATFEQNDLQMLAQFEGANSPFLGVVNTAQGQSLMLDSSRVLDIELCEPGPELRVKAGVPKAKGEGP